jgi:putative ABC transport system substrate-binding protein
VNRRSFLCGSLLSTRRASGRRRSVEGQNLTIEHLSSAGQYERLPALAKDLVGLKVDVIVVPTGQNALAAHQATRTIPIVVASLGDPTRSGLVASFAHPGGNVTGLSVAGPELR